MRGKARIRAFSLVELVVVIVIIGILAAMAIPRLSRGSSGANSAAVSGNLATIRRAIQLYYNEHKDTYPSAAIADELTQYTDINGNTSATKTGNFIYGPYLTAMPPAPVGENAGDATVLIDSTNSPPTVVTTGGEGWLYNPNTGEFLINTEQTDDSGTKYNTY